MPKGQQLQGSRQRPVSCRFCRSRKLRCSREAPCSNCVSRRIHCDLEDVARPSAGTANSSESELLERIRKLEELVESQKPSDNESVNQSSKQSSENGEPYNQQAPKPNTLPQTDHLDSDVAWLESIYHGHTLQDQTPSNKIIFRICPIQQVIGSQPYLNQNTFLSSAYVEPLRCVWLPQYHEAKMLLEKYIRDMDHVHHVIHTPSLPAVLDDVYECLSKQGQVNPGKVILLLAIFASCTHSWVREDCQWGIFSTSEEANAQPQLWIKAIEDVLDISHRTTRVSIEGIQGICIASFVMLSMEGFSRRPRSFFNTCFLLARELGLHVLDHPSNVDSANNVQTEVGRRVWWYLVATDWQIPSRFRGTAAGIYQCNPRHMLTRKPLNLNDEDLVDGTTFVEKPLSQPTTMSYSLQRIRLAEISRHMVDRTPLMMSTGPSHDVIMDMDTELQLLVNDTPQFFSMSVAELTATYQLDSSRAADIAHQGYMFFGLLYSQRCALHFPYFSRGFLDSTYASSREICLQSARKVIQLEAQLGTSGLTTAIRYKFLGLLVSIFMASIVVLMDLCQNKSSVHQETQQKEIAEAIRIIEEARHESETAARFLDSLLHVLRKHKLLPPKRTGDQLPKSGISNEDLSAGLVGETYDAGSTQNLDGPVVIPIGSSNMFDVNDPSGIAMNDDTIGTGEDLSMYFNELAQTFEQGVDFDWNDIFSGLDPSSI